MKGKRDNILQYFIAFCIHCGLVNDLFVNISILLLGYLSPIIALSFNVLQVMLIMMTCLYILNRRWINKKVVCMFCIWVLMFIISCIFNTGMGLIAFKLIHYYIYNIFLTILLFSQISSVGGLEQKFKFYIYVAVVYSALQYFVFIKNGEYSMNYSYNVMIPALLSLCMVINHQKKYFLFPLAYLFIINLICGSRGSIICYGIAIMLIIYMKKKGKIIFTMLFLIMIVCLYYFKQIFIVLSEFFPMSRTIKLFAEGDVFYLSGRNVYYEYIIKMIYKDSWKMHGIYSDRLFLAEYFHRIEPNEIFGSYAHNFFLEVLFQFGFIGIPVIVASIGILVYTGYRVKKKEHSLVVKDLFIVSFAYCIGQLMVSSSYLIAPSFGLLVGELFVIYSKKRKQNEKNINKY